MIRILVLCEAFGNAEVDKDALYRTCGGWP